MVRYLGRIAFRWVSAACAALAIATAASGNPPAALAPSSDAGVRVSFERFAERWMEKVRQRGEAERNRPTLAPGVAEPVVIYRDCGDEFSIELQPTGRSGAPYLGILRYTEELFSCSGLDAKRCTIASSTPVTEVFRFRQGRWVY